MSLERLTSSGFGTRNSQITRPPRAIIVPGTMKEYDQSSSTQTAKKNYVKSVFDLFDLHSEEISIVFLSLGFHVKSILADFKGSKSVIFTIL